MKTITVGANEAGQRLDKFLAKYLSLATKGFLYKMIRKKNITLNNKRCSGSEKLKEGDEIAFFLSDETIGRFSESRAPALPRTRKKDLPIIYEDEHILLINKPPGMLSQKAKDTDISLVEYLIDYLLRTGSLTQEDLRSFRPSVCSRLDRNTSGLTAAGKTLPGLQALCALFRERSLHKYYLCIVEGQAADGQRIKGYLKKDRGQNRVAITDAPQPGSDFIETEYWPLACRDGRTLLLVALLTGRTHQIRAHLSSVGFPIVGDVKYGWTRTSDSGNFHSQLLHSYMLEFPGKMPSPLSNLHGRRFTAPPPAKFRQLFPELDAILDNTAAAFAKKHAEAENKGES